MRPIWATLGLWIYNLGKIFLFTFSCYRILNFSGEVMQAGKSSVLALTDWFRNGMGWDAFTCAIMLIVTLSSLGYSSKWQMGAYKCECEYWVMGLGLVRILLGLLRFRGQSTSNHAAPFLTTIQNSEHKCFLDRESTVSSSFSWLKPCQKQTGIFVYLNRNLDTNLYARMTTFGTKSILLALNYASILLCKHLKLPISFSDRAQRSQNRTSNILNGG